MKVKEITSYIEAFAPKETALSFDNVGLLVGRAESEVTGVVICVDFTKEAYLTAKRMGYNLIITHHPAIFTPLNTVTDEDYLADLVATAYADGISVYSAHTNVDRSERNMAIRLFDELNAENVTQFVNGLGAIGDIKPESLSALTEKIGKVLNDNLAFCVGDPERVISRIAEINGAGCDNETISAAVKQGADAFISADIKHHMMLRAKQSGLSLISVGHYASEKSFIDIVYDSIKCHYDTTKINKHFEGNPYN